MFTLVEVSLACRRSPEIPCDGQHQEDSQHAQFTLNVITSGRQEVTVQKDRKYNRVTVRGIDPEMMVSADDAKDLAALFAGVAKMPTD